MNRISRSTAKAAAVLVALAACGQAEDNPDNQPVGDIRGVEELANPNLAALASGDAVYTTSNGKLAVTLQGSETAVIVSKRASDGAILLNGQPVIDSLKATIALSSAVKWIVVNVGAADTTVIFDYYNGTFAPGIKPVSPALFGASAGTQVVFGAYAGGAFKIRGSTGADTIYVGQDAATSSPGVFVSFSGNTWPDLYVTATTAPSFGFSLGAGNDVFDASGTKGGTNKELSFPVSVHGGVGNDTMIGGAAADTLYGDEGINSIDESSDSTTSHVADTVYGLTTPPSVTGTNSTTVTYANWANTTTGVNVQIAHLATALISGVTDNIDDTVGVVIGSPLADTMECSQLTDVPCLLEGGAGNDMLSPGLSAINTDYLYGGDGNDTFAMNTIANHVALVGGNISDITTTKNLYVDTVDYSSAISATSPVNTTIDMNGTAPTTCTVATSTTIPPCPGVADAVPSGLAGSAHTDIRNDITVAKCPTGTHSAGVVCTAKANTSTTTGISGNTIYSGWGADLLTGGTGDDTFVLADFNGTAHYTGTVTKVITGGGGNDTADFSAHTSVTAINLNCTSAACTNYSGNPVGLTSGDAAASTSATADATTLATDTTAVETAYAAITSGEGTPTATDTAENAAAAAANTAGAAAATALATAVLHPGNAVDAAAVGTALTALNSAVTASEAANAAYVSGTDDEATNAAAVTAATEASTLATVVGDFSTASEGIVLVNVNNAVCPAGGTQACAVTTNANSDVIDFSGDGAVSGSSLTCNSSSVLTVNATGLAANCGL